MVDHSGWDQSFLWDFSFPGTGTGQSSGPTTGPDHLNVTGSDQRRRCSCYCSRYSNIFKCCNALNALRSASSLYERHPSTNSEISDVNDIKPFDTSELHEYENLRTLVQPCKNDLERLVQSDVDDMIKLECTDIEQIFMDEEMEYRDFKGDGMNCDGLCRISALLDAVQRRKNRAIAENEYLISNSDKNGFRTMKSLDNVIGHSWDDSKLKCIPTKTTIDEPEDTISEPNHMISEPNNMISEPKHMIGEPKNMTDQPNFSEINYKFLPAWDLKRLETVFLRLFASRFYFGKLSADEAKNLLKERPVGTFLIRDSSDPRYLLALSIQTPRGTTSVRIVYNLGTFRLDCEPEQVNSMPTFDCVLKLIKHYMSIPSRNVLIESSGRRDTYVLLNESLVVGISPLVHLCRKRINRILDGRSVDRLCLSPSLKVFLKDYPYDV